MGFEPWQLAMIDAAGYNGIRQEHIRAVADQIQRLPQDTIDTASFRGACRRAGVDPDRFGPADLAALQDLLDP